MGIRRPRRRRTVPFRHVFVLSVIFFILTTVWGLWMINVGIKPVLMDIAETKARQIATTALNKGIPYKELDEAEKDQAHPLSEINYDNKQEINILTYNTAAVGKVFSKMTNDIQENLREVEQKGSITNIPLGQATNNIFLANLGPEIPVRLRSISNVHPDIKTKLTPLNINNVYIEIYAEVTVEVMVVIPFGTTPVKQPLHVPITSQLYTGNVPLYWGGDGSQKPTLLLPDNKKDAQGSGKATSGHSTTKGKSFNQ